MKKGEEFAPFILVFTFLFPLSLLVSTLLFFITPPFLFLPPAFIPLRPACAKRILAQTCVVSTQRVSMLCAAFTRSTTGVGSLQGIPSFSFFFSVSSIVSPFLPHPLPSPSPSLSFSPPYLQDESSTSTLFFHLFSFLFLSFFHLTVSRVGKNPCSQILLSSYQQKQN